MLLLGTRILVAAGILSVVPTPAHAQESQTYVADRISVTAGAEACSSFTFDNSLVISPVAPAGHAVACDGRGLARFGFWSVLGTVDAPIILTVGRNLSDRTVVDLSWTGSESSYQVYRSDLPGSVLDPGNLLSETSSCNETDLAAALSDIRFYQVVAQP